MQQQQQQQHSPVGLPLLQPLLQQQLLPPQDAADRQEEQGDITTPPALPLELAASAYFSLEQEGSCNLGGTGSAIRELRVSASASPGQQLVPLLPLSADDLQAASAVAPAAAFHSSSSGGNPVVLGSPIQVAAASPVQRGRQQQPRQPVSEAGGRPQLALAARQQAGSSSSLRLDAGLREGGNSFDFSADAAQEAGSSAGLGAQEQQRLQLLESALLVIGGLTARGYVWGWGGATLSQQACCAS
jgi:hypothetical protein